MTLPAWQFWQRAAANQWSSTLSPIVRWYFGDNIIAYDAAQSPLPVWVAGADDIPHCRLLDWQTAEREDGSRFALQLPPRLASNRSWVDDSTLAFLQQRRVSLRGNWLHHGAQLVFQPRVIWPDDFTFDHFTHHGAIDLATTLRTDQHNASAPFQIRRLWQAQHTCADDFVLGFVLNGAQGDDDEAHGGHFAIVLGQLRNNDPRDLLVANYYNPDVVSEKGILPAMTPLSNYLAELNSGQQYYRPSSLVAVRVQQADFLAPLYNALLQHMVAMYEHQWLYDHAFMNCTGITMDALRGSELAVPRAGSSAWLAPLAYALTWLRERDVQRARRVMRYLCSERTRLFPAQAFMACAYYVLSLLTGRRGANSDFERALCQHAVALDYVRLPQFPSSRAWGREPLFSLQDYRNRMPSNRSDWKIIPVQTRTFPTEWLPTGVTKK